jgi:LysM repeat protein
LEIGILSKGGSKMRSKYLYGLLGFSVLLSGCVVRTYPLTRDRVDQDLSAGNRGFIQGSAPAVTGERKTKRTTRVVEIELRSPVRIDRRSPEAVPEPSPYTPTSEEEWSGSEQDYMAESLEPETTFEKYTVKKGDTLQKISQKYFGTTKRWMKIYEANKGTLKGPDKIYVGQVLNIPADSSREMPERIK